MTLPLFAVDVVQLVIIVLFLFGAGLGQLLKTLQERLKAPPQARPKPPGGEALSSLEAEIKDFLRKAQAGGAKVDGPPPVTQRAPQDRSTPPSQPRPQKAKKKSSANQGKGRPPRSPEPIVAEVVAPNESVAGHVQRHILTGGVVTRDAHLAQDISQADERIEGHLASVFQHRVGQLSRKDDQINTISQGTDAVFTSGDESPSVAAQLRTMLVNPQHCATAFVLSEILRRPEDHWD